MNKKSRKRDARIAAAVRDAQRRYDLLEADVKTLFNAIINWSVKGQEALLLDFNSYSWPRELYDYLVYNDIHKLIIQKHNESERLKNEHEG